MIFLPNKYFLILLLIAFRLSAFSHDSTIVWNTPILIAIEDSVRDQLSTPNDSTWLNDNLSLHNGRFPDEDIKYKLVDITQEDFLEGPLPFYLSLNQNDTPRIIQEPTFGDLIYQMSGERVYTYIGNTSRGFYNLYHFERVYPILKELDVKWNDLSCEHGWDMQREMACPACMLKEQEQQELIKELE